MPLKLYPPDAKAKRPNWRIRGTYLGVNVERSTGTGEKRLAVKALAKIKDEIERGAFATPGVATFASAAALYMRNGGETRFMEPLLLHFGEKPLPAIDQQAIDAAAASIYPTATNATRNRQVYSPVSSVLKAGGVTMALKRPKGARGTVRLHWLRPDEAMALLDAADAMNPRFGALLTFLLYTGCRLNEALALTPADLSLPESFAYVRDTKNGSPRPVHLPVSVVAALANIDTTARVFGWHKSGRLYTWLDDAAKAAGVTIPPGIAFHLFRHSYGAWQRRYGKLDTSGLVATGAWKSRQAAAVYEHADVTESAKRSDLFPTRSKSGRKGKAKT
jgi:integrase